MRTCSAIGSGLGACGAISATASRARSQVADRDALGEQELSIANRPDCE